LHGRWVSSTVKESRRFVPGMLTGQLGAQSPVREVAVDCSG
jgi:hypothetical protein